MAAVLPSSLSPHICVLPSPDLVALLKDASLPPLHQLLQSMSPVQNVSTRTTALATVSLASFALRFSDLLQVETACKEDEDSRAGRAIDWLGARVARRANDWLSEGARPKAAGARTAWWDELRKCAEGDLAPNRTEGWNHPAAIILAVSTSAPNPLAAITALHSRPVDLPQWVDPNILRFTLIVHSSRSPLNDEECLALFNAAKRQYGQHAHLLSLQLDGPASPTPLFNLPPRLPLPSDASLPEVPEQQELRLSQADVHQAGKFVREFVVMSLVPWMERCVLDWNENFAANRRVATRLFSTTRRFFGSQSQSISSGYSTSTSSPASPTANSQLPLPASAPPQQRRLAEFATILGDYKLAIPVWETWRKEGRGGSEVLPLTLAPSPAVGAHVSYALQSFQGSESTALNQYRALLFAVRWEAGVPDFVTQGGDRWLSWAAGHSEEPFAAILLAHAALLAARTGGMRRASMWYVDAALRMEKSGIKPLAIHFLRQADDILKLRQNDHISPLFEDAVGPSAMGFPAIPLRIEHSLARLLYSTGHLEETAQLFTQLFRAYTDVRAAHLYDEASGHAQGLLDDFRVAFEHIHSTNDEHKLLDKLEPTIALAVPNSTKLRFDRHGASGNVPEERWATLDGQWAAFAKRQGLGAPGKNCQAGVTERFWVDVALQNPLPVEIVITKISLVVEQTTTDGQSPEIETLEEVVLAPKEFRTVSVAVTARHASTLRISHLTYSFLSVLPMRESLARKGKRLDTTPAQRQIPTYAPDIVLSVEVGGDAPRLDVTWAPEDVRSRGYAYEDEQAPMRFDLVRGELLATGLTFTNVGTKPIAELWILRPANSGIVAVGNLDVVEDVPVAATSNSIAPPEPQRISIDSISSSPILQPGAACTVPIILSPAEVGPLDVCVVALFREDEAATFYSRRSSRAFHVHNLVEAALVASPRPNADGSFVVDIELDNRSGDSIEITDISSISPSWSTALLSGSTFSTQALHPSQVTRVLLRAEPWTDGKGGAETEQHVTAMLEGVVRGQPVTSRSLPTLDLKLSSLAKTSSNAAPGARMAAETARRVISRRTLAAQFDNMPDENLPSIFPLYHPRSVDIVVHWHIPSEKRSGLLVLSNQLALGAAHGGLNPLIDASRSAKAKRTMFAETDRLQAVLLETLSGSVWNEEMNPLVVRVASATVNHDFSKGPCSLPVQFVVHNYSVTRAARFVLRLSNEDRPPGKHKPATFIGGLAYRRTLPPLGHTTVSARVWVPAPGQYTVGGWRLETLVAAQDAPIPLPADATPSARYVQFAQRETVLDVVNASS